MATITIRVPDQLKEIIKAFVEKGLYTNESEFIRDAIRDKISVDSFKQAYVEVKQNE